MKRFFRPRFSLRLLFVLLTALAISLGVYVERVREQRAIVAELKELGATVKLDFEAKGRGRVSPQAAAPPGPRWLRRWLGDDFFAHVTEVSFAPGDVTDDQLRMLWKLRRLKYVSLRESAASDDLVRRLQATFPALMVHHRNSAWLGAMLIDKKESPCSIGGVMAGSSAENAGLQKGDAIVALNDEAVDDIHDLSLKVSHFRPQDKIVLRIRRGDEVLEQTVVLGRAPGFNAAKK